MVGEQQFKSLKSLIYSPDMNTNLTTMNYDTKIYEVVPQTPIMVQQDKPTNIANSI